MLEGKLRIYQEFQSRDAEFQEIRIFEDGWIKWNEYQQWEEWSWKIPNMTRFARLIHPDWKEIERKEKEKNG